MTLRYWAWEFKLKDKCWLPEGQITFLDRTTLNFSITDKILRVDYVCSTEEENSQEIECRQAEGLQRGKDTALSGEDDWLSAPYCKTYFGVRACLPASANVSQY